MIKLSWFFCFLLVCSVCFGQRINEINYAAEVPAPEYLGVNVNSPFAERLPIISPDGKTLYFARKYHPHNMGEENQDDIWVSYRKPDGSWSQAQNIGEPLNNAKHNFVCATSPDGKTLYLANDYSKRNMKDGLSVSQKTRNGWSFPKALNIKNHYNRNPFVCYHVSVDQKSVLMTVERDEGFGDRDVYVSFRYSDGNWSEPRNLGPTINTRGMEASVFIAADNKTIYFSSDGHPGYGGLDVFMSKRLDDTWQNWTKPVNLGSKINKPGHDFNYTIPASGEYAYFSSDFEAPVPGMSNLYRIRLPEEVRPEPVQLITGKLIHAEPGQPEQDLPDEYQIVVPYDQDKADLLSELQGFFVAESPDPETTPDIEEVDYDGDDPALMPVPQRGTQQEDSELKKKQEELKALREQLASLEKDLETREKEPEVVASYAPADIPPQRESKSSPQLSALQQKYASLWDDDPSFEVKEQPVYRKPKPKREKVQRGPTTKEELYSSLFEPDPIPVEPESPAVDVTPESPPFTSSQETPENLVNSETPSAKTRDSRLEEKQRKYKELYGETPVLKMEGTTDTPAKPPVTIEEPVIKEVIEEKPEELVSDPVEPGNSATTEPAINIDQSTSPTPPRASFEELEEKVRKELENEMRDEIRRELQNELRPGVQDEIADEIRDDVRKEVELQLREDLKTDVENDLASNLRPEVEDQLKEDLKEDVRKELQDELKDEVENELRNQMRSDIEKELKEALRQEMEEEVRDQLRKEMEQELKREEQRLRREIEEKLRRQMRERERDIAANNSFSQPDNEEPAYRELNKDMVLYPIKVGQIIPMDNIYFDANKTTLKEASFIELQKVLDFLNNNKNLVVEISGHTNGLCSTEFAEELSDGRSKVVTEYLIEHGVSGDRLSYRGYGKTRPIASNDTVAGRKKNQRVEMKILEILKDK